MRTPRMMTKAGQQLGGPKQPSVQMSRTKGPRRKDANHVGKCLEKSFTKLLEDSERFSFRLKTIKEKNEKTTATFKNTGKIVKERKCTCLHTWFMSRQYLLAVTVKTMNMKETEKM